MARHRTFGWGRPSLATTIGAWTAAVVLLAAGLSFFPVHRRLSDALIRDRTNQMAAELRLAAALWERDLDRAETDALTLAYLKPVTVLLDGQEPSIEAAHPEGSTPSAGGGQEPSVPSMAPLLNDKAQGAATALASIFSGLLTRHPQYMQARILSAHGAGYELLRLDRSIAGGPVSRVPADQLQAKSEESYFQRALQVTSTAPLLTTPITWNREHGRVAEPLTLMVRHTVTRFDAAGRPTGVFVLNVGILDQLTRLLAESLAEEEAFGFVVNEEAQWIVPPVDSAKRPLMNARPLSSVGVADLLGTDWRARMSSRSTTYVNTPTGNLSDKGPFVVALRQVDLEEAGTAWIGQVTSYSQAMGSATAALRWSAGAALIIMLGGMLVGWFGVRRLLAPVRRLVASVAAFHRSGGQDTPPPASSGGNEVRRLEAEFKRMMARVDQQQRELSEAEASLTVALAQARASNSELESFAHSVAHDLRAPIRALRFRTSLLLDAYGDSVSAEALEQTHEIAATAVRMSALVEGLLRASSIDAHALVLASFDLKELAEQAWKDLQAPPTARLEVPDRLVVNGDRQLVGRLLQNLLDNALKYSASRAVPTVTVGCEPTAQGLAYFVRDNGIGLDVASCPRIFQLFERAPGAEGFEGVGVGLAIARRVAERHGGQMWVESSPGQGATFFFTLAPAP